MAICWDPSYSKYLAMYRKASVSANRLIVYIKLPWLMKKVLFMKSMLKVARMRKPFKNGDSFVFLSFESLGSWSGCLKFPLDENDWSAR